LNDQDKIKSSLKKLENYLDTTDLKGYDPYDALNSNILTRLAFNRRRLRIAYTQLFKISPVNLRPLFRVKKGYNPKGLGLFLTGYLKLFDLDKTEKYLEEINRIISRLEDIKSNGYSGYCWGYNFDWQSKAFFTSKFTPTIINTTFVAHSFLDAYELLKKRYFFEIARSCCDFILNDLSISREGDFICFSYTPRDMLKVHNANMLAAGLLARLYSITGEDILLEYAKNATGYVISKQRPDGSWHYAETDYQNWIDCHHTGFILEGLYNYIKYTSDKTYLDNILKGLAFFTDHFFHKNGQTRFYHNKDYPIDIHCPAQAIITLLKLKELGDHEELIKNIAFWMIDNMQDYRGYFYYRKGKFFYNKISYIRWSQAWAFHALTTYYTFLRHFNIRDNFQ
jgi:rhamnogalacturonyl hydrolase YesR